MTIIGLFILSLGVLIILPFDSTMTMPLPSWVYILFALLVFLGQTIDAIDGKHARNTNRCSPLGQLMDHGCDAFSNSFVVIMLAQAHLMGSSIFNVATQTLVQLSFFVISWEEHHTGILMTHINNMGVTEFQFIGMGVVIMPVFLGHEFSKLKPLNGLVPLTVVELIVIVNGLL